MKEIIGNLWDYYGREDFIVLITTNGTIKANGRGTMVKGSAAEARLKIPGIERQLGRFLKQFGNVFMLTDAGYGFFPMKHNWWEPADPALIAQSAKQLKIMSEHRDFIGKNFVLPRPGCGNGGLYWPDVKIILEKIDLPDNILVISKAPYVQPNQ